MNSFYRVLSAVDSWIFSRIFPISPEEKAELNRKIAEFLELPASSDYKKPSPNSEGENTNP